MKKKCVCWLMAVLLTLSAGWGAAAKEPPPLKLDSAAAVVLQYGRTFAEVTDPAQVARLGEMFMSPAYEKGESNANYVGWEYMVRWYDASGQEIEVVQVNTENLIAHGGYFYTLSGGQLDFQYFRRLLLPSYLTQDLQRVMEAVRNAALLAKA